VKVLFGEQTLENDDFLFFLADVAAMTVCIIQFGYFC